MARLVASYRAIPPHTRVRLAKRTSNLFRARERSATPGLDVSGLDGVISIDARGRTADVAGMCTYEGWWTPPCSMVSRPWSCPS